MSSGWKSLKKMKKTIMTKDSVSNHLLELRSRLLRVFALFGILSLIGFPFATQIYSFVAAPLIEILPIGTTMIATEVASPFMAPIKLVLYLAMLFSMPWLFFQIWMFTSPGLYENEKKLTAPLMLSTVVLFFNWTCEKMLCCFQMSCVSPPSGFLVSIVCPYFGILLLMNETRSSKYG